MKILKIIVILFLASNIQIAYAAPDDQTNRWDNLTDVAYRFTWYPKEDLQILLKDKSDEYGQSLEEYQLRLKEELANTSTNIEVIDPDSFVPDKPWKKYYRLAVAQFCLFLTSDNEIYLENAKSALSVLASKKELPEIAFWHYLFQAYSAMTKRERDAFVDSVCNLWQNLILKLEVEDLITDSHIYKAEFVKDLPFLYENIAHLIIYKAIIDNNLPDLYPLGIIILSIKDKLNNQHGHKIIVEAIIERMHGLKSDNSNLNFAVAFVEATAYHHDFEDDKFSKSASSNLNLARHYYNLALSWSDTSKGKIAILTQYMGLYNYILRHLIDIDTTLTEDFPMIDLAGEANRLINDSMSLYEQLAKSSVLPGGLKAEGFKNESKYVKAMHQLWDSSAKLSMMLSAYYKTQFQPNKTTNMNAAEIPLTKYLSFFYKYASENSRILPNNAFFLAGYAANQLSHMYRQAANYSTKIEINNLALDYQLKAVELFPLDIVGILELAHQTSQEGRRNLYLQRVGPLTSRLRNSKVASTWPKKHSTTYNDLVALVSSVIPDVIDKAPLIIFLLQHSDGLLSEDIIFDKTIMMVKLLEALEDKYTEQEIHTALLSIARKDLSGKHVDVLDTLRVTLPPNFYTVAHSVPGIDTRYHISRLRSALYADPNNPVHSYLRELYYENLLNLISRVAINWSKVDNL